MILPDVGPGNKRGLGFSCGGRVCGCGLVGGYFLGSGEGCVRPIRGTSGRLAGRPYWGSGQGGGEGERRVRPEERGPCPSGDGFLPPQERRRKREGEGMEGPGRLRSKAATPVPCPPQRMFHIGAGFATAPCF